MYRVRVTSKQGQRRMKKQISTETFPTVEAARSFIADSIHRQEKLCWRGWGLCTVEATEAGNVTTAIYRPAMVLFDQLVQTFTITEAA